MILTQADAMQAAAIAAIPELEGLPIILHDGGWDSVALEFGGMWICKFPRDEDALEALRREVALLAAVRRSLAICVPDMQLFLGPATFTRHRKLPGEALLPAGYARLEPAQRARLADDVARFLAELHGLDLDLAALDIGADDENFDAEAVAATALPLLPSALRPAAERTLADRRALRPDPLGEGLCHLDAHGRNFAFDHAAGRLAGIFDFGDAALAGRHEEFIEPAYIARDCARRVIDAYERQTSRTIDRSPWLR